MKQFQLVAALAVALAAIVTGCASETTGPSESGSVGVNLLIGNTDVTAVNFEVVCDSGITLVGQFNVVDDRDPPIWAAIMDLPPGLCTVTMVAFDDAGAPLCTGSKEFEVLVDQTIKVDVVLVCLVDGEDPLGNVDVDATFEIIVGNNCPRLHFFNAVPIEVPADGSLVTALVSDADDDPLTVGFSATAGIFGDPNTPGEGCTSRTCTYRCDGAAGVQTLTTTVSDGEMACDKSKTFDVVCPGVNPCEGVVCDDTGNPCTFEECNPANGQCEVQNVPNDTACDAGGIDDLADNGGVEEGTLNGWTDQEFCVGICEASDTMPNTGVYSARMFNDQPASGSVLKQANKGVGIVQPNSQVTVRFAAKGNFAAGGVAVAEFFSEIDPEGVSKTEILGGGPFFTDTQTEYQLFEFVVTTGDDVSGGVTVQFVAATGTAAGSLAELFIDDVVILVEGGGAGTCQNGECVPSDLCAGVDCNDDNECTIDECNPADGSCTNTADPGASCDGGAGTCDAAGMCQPIDLCAGVDCNDNNECTIDVCDPADGSCSNTPDDGASCDGGNGTCDAAGECQPIDLCAGNTCDDEDTECSDSSCDPGTGECVATPINEGGACDGGAGNCSAGGFCVPNPTANGFIKTLDPATGFQVDLIDTVDTTNLPDSWGGYTASITIPDDAAFIGHILQFGFQTNASDFDDSGNFYDNVLLTDPAIVYTQDFNGLPIVPGGLIGDGWRYFVNVFEGNGNYRFGFGGDAPQGPQISDLVTGQGGVEQEPTQLSVYSDYECCNPDIGHRNGTDLVETNVFQERVLTADDLGKTFEFQFQAKAGNIGP